MSKQDKAAKAVKIATAQAGAIIEAAVEKVTKPRRGALSAEHAALAGSVKELRETGMAWWQIGFKLSLPGNADTVAKGKGGAAFARKIYKAAFGEVPRVQVRDGSRANREKNEDIKALRKTKKADRVAQVRSGETVLRDDMTEAEVVATLRGRTIGWFINLNKVDGRGDLFAEQEASVHRRFCKVETHSGERCVVFKEVDLTAPIKYREMAGATRIVRLANIHTVR